MTYDIDYNSFFGQSFLSWQGNKILFEQSSWLFYLIVLVMLFASISTIIFKGNIRGLYLYNRAKFDRFFLMFGLFFLFMYVFRIAILTIGGYPNLWEVVPLHFCRFFGFLFIITFLMKKTEFIKYYGFFAVGGALFGLAIPDLGNSEYWQEFGGMSTGMDSYVFWDFLIIHTSILFVSCFLITAISPEYTKKDVIINLGGMAGIALLMLVLDFLLKDVPMQGWKANWWYLSIDSINGIDDKLRPILGVMADWPFIFIFFVMIGIGAYFMMLFIYFGVDKLEIPYLTYKKSFAKKIYIFKSHKYEVFKTSKLIRKRN